MYLSRETTAGTSSQRTCCFVTMGLHSCATLGLQGTLRGTSRVPTILSQSATLHCYPSPSSVLLSSAPRLLTAAVLKLAGQHNFWLWGVGMRVLALCHILRSFVQFAVLLPAESSLPFSFMPAWCAATWALAGIVLQSFYSGSTNKELEAHAFTCVTQRLWICGQSAA
jgi:hypothetical protein